MTITVPYRPVSAWRSPKGTTPGKREPVPPEPNNTDTPPHDIAPRPPAPRGEQPGHYVLSIESVNEFFYGYRFVQTFKHGTQKWEQVPLTLEDMWFPQVDDKMGQSWGHSHVGYLLYTLLYHYLQKLPGVCVLYDVIMRWGIPGQRDFVPDILVLMDVPHIPEHKEGIFDRGKYGGVPVLAVELTSKSTRYIDVNTDGSDDSKYREYEYIGVTYYVVVDLARKPKHAAPAFWGYHLVGTQYQPLQYDQHGRLWLPQVGVALGVHNDSLAWFDAHGNRLLSLEEQEARADQEAEARQAAEIQLMLEKERAEQEKYRAEQEAHARQAAEAELRQLKAKLGIEHEG